MTRFLTSRIALPLVAGAAALLGAGATWLVQRQTSGDAVRTYLLDHPEVLPEAMALLEQRNSAKTIVANRRDIVNAIGSAWAGNKNGDVTVVEYLDYNCGYCKAAVPVVNALIAADPKVKIVYREWPVLSDESVTAGRYGVAVARLGGNYARLHDAFYAKHPLTTEGMDAAVRAAGLDPTVVKKAVAAPEVDETIRVNLSLMRQLSQSGTPAWIIGNRVYSGMMSIDEMKDAVAVARKKNPA